MRNVTLIGMPGAGKSTVGVVLAKILGFDFIDSDLLIQAREGRLLWQIIESEGIEGFWRVEERVNASIEAENSVIATGGSVVYGTEAMAHLRAIGTVVYLKLSYEILEKRLHNIRGRGVVLKEGQTLRDLYLERVPLYEKYADITVDEGNRDVEETIARILEEYEARHKKPENA